MASAPLVSVSTTVMSHEDGAACVDAVRRLFPNFLPNFEANEPAGFPAANGRVQLDCDDCDTVAFIEQMAEARILDTGLDAMSMHLKGRETWFLLSRQAAVAGKVAFVLPGERSLGGVIRVKLQGADLGEWLTEATWHPGRLDVPRDVADDVSMRRDGAVTEWFDKHGRPTIQTDED